MADRRANIAYAVFGLGAALALSIGMGAELKMSLSDGLWFEVLVLIVISAFLMEPHYSGGASAAANSVAVVFLALQADRDQHPEWWAALLAVALAAFAASVLSFVLRDAAVGSPTPARVGRALGQVAAVLGSWRCILLGALGLCLATFNDVFGDEWSVSIVVTAFCLFVTRFQPLSVLRALRGTPLADSTATVAALFPPFEAVVTANGAAGLALGSSVRVSSGLRSAPGVLTAEVSHGGARAWRAFVPQLMAVLPDTAAGSDAPQLVVEPDAARGHGLEEVTEELESQGVEIIGTMTEGTAIRSAVIELLPGRRVELGDVLWTRDIKGRTLWQVADATLARTAWSGDARRSTQVHATQIGRWDDSNVAFEADARSPRPAEVTFAGMLPSPSVAEPPPGSIQIGSLPKSPFPVLVDLTQLSRTHCAILGMTGTGKTHLAFALVQALVNLGVKIICVDMTGQYRARFPSAINAATANEVGSFLAGVDQIAVCSPDHGAAIKTANAVSRKVYDWASSQPALQPSSAARCVILFEEAQNFIPEAFVVDDWTLKAKAQDTSLVVMESRKFGVGFLVVSQRTAMITKSALSQCNTIFAFQAVDQTGLDYLEGLCGSTLVRGVPTLPHRTAIVMGSALRSASPVIAYIDDAAVLVP